MKFTVWSFRLGVLRRWLFGLAASLAVMPTLAQQCVAYSYNGAPQRYDTTVTTTDYSAYWHSDWGPDRSWFPTEQSACVAVPGLIAKVQASPDGNGVMHSFSNPLVLPDANHWLNRCQIDHTWTYGPPGWSTTSSVTYQPSFAINQRQCHVCLPGSAWVENANACMPVIDIDRTAKKLPDVCVGNPINPLQATKREELDTGIAAGKLRLKFTYDSSPIAPIAPGGARPSATKPAVLGALWSSTVHRKILIESSGKGALVSRGDGRTISFLGSGGGLFTPEADNSDQLLSVVGGYRYFDAAVQVQETYDSSGSLVAMHWTVGDALNFTYSTSATSTSIAPAAGYLLQVQDRQGRSTSFTYQLSAGADPAKDGLLASVTDARGLVTSVAYDGAGNLTSVTGPDGKSRVFHYENAAVPQGLTGITDERGVRYATFGYDSEGRAISTEHAGGVGRYSVTYGTPPRIGVTEIYDKVAQVIYRYHDWLLGEDTRITTPRGTQVAMDAVSIRGKSYLTSRSQPAGSGCAASTSQMAYDADGNLASRDDFNGNRACYFHDLSRNLQTVLVEGLAPTQACNLVTPASATLPAGSRKTSTEWHPYWQLATRKAEPGKRTTSVYNGQPDPTAGGAAASCAPAAALLPDGQPIAVLCKQIEQATTDSDGATAFAAPLQAAVAPRTRSWTYNERGQVLTDKDALGRTTTYAYYSTSTADWLAGDLQSVTNPRGQATRHTKYNAAGKLLESIDPNGATTTYSYDLRGRLTATSVAGQTTTFAYDASGQPTRTTRPDGSWVEYSYDPARRMNAVTDNLGNRIDYTLDAEGKVTAQTVKDPQGSIARTLSLSIDALGRVQQIVGRPD